MDARRGIQFLGQMSLEQQIRPKDINEALYVARNNSPSKSIKLARMYAQRELELDEMLRIKYSKGVRWLAKLLKESGPNLYSIYVLQMAVDWKMLIDANMLLQLPSEARSTSIVRLAEEKHFLQFRHGGERHFMHVLRVGLNVARHYLEKGDKENALEGFVVGVGHDLLEDTDLTESELETHVWNTAPIKALTHVEEEEPDEIYLARVAIGGELSIITKRYDKLDNILKLVEAPGEFRQRKIAENLAALPLWQAMDPDGARMIETALHQVRLGG